MRAATADVPLPTIKSSTSAASLLQFQAVSTDEVISAVRALPDKCCLLDPLQTKLFKTVVDLNAPFIAEVFNRSLSTGHVPDNFKTAYITPRLKKNNMDPVDPSSYRPISNLSVLSKLLERLVACRLLAHLRSSGLLPRLQSAYRANHSVETAVLKVLSDILLAIDNGDLSSLVSLDLSSAFDTVDHSILLQRLELTFGIGEMALSWFRSYLDGRRQQVRAGRSSSSLSVIHCGVPCYILPTCCR